MREIKAKQILESGGVRRINSVRYEVKSQSSDRKYSVILTDKGWECNCPDRNSEVQVQNMQQDIFPEHRV